MSSQSQDETLPLHHIGPLPAFINKAFLGHHNDPCFWVMSLLLPSLHTLKTKEIL